IPMAISYEYEPCDTLKAREIVIKNSTGTYKKAPDEDLKSMLTGITDYKGRFHIAMGSCLSEKLERMDTSVSKNDLMKEIAALVNEVIYALYKLWPTNYIAFDLLNDSEQYKDKYSHTEQQAFIDHLEKAVAKDAQPKEEMKLTLLNIYANPVQNT